MTAGIFRDPRWLAALGISLVINMAFFGNASRMFESFPRRDEAREFIPVSIMQMDQEEITQPPPPPPVRQRRQPPPPPVPVPEQPIMTVEPKPAPLPVAEEPPPAPPAPLEPRPAPQPVMDEPPPPAVPPVAQQQVASIKTEFQPVYKVGKPPVYKTKILPSYPESERAQGTETRVVAEVFITERGEVHEVRIAKSGGVAFDRAVIRSLKESVFAPGYIDDRPVAVRVQIPFLFKLD